MKLKCKQALCLWTGSPDLSMSGDHIKATCPKCYAYIKFVKLLELDHFDLENLKAWQEKQVEDECDFTHNDRHILRDEIEEHLGDFNYCPGCGIPLKGGE